MPKNPPQDKQTFAEKRAVSAYKRERNARRAVPRTLSSIMKDQGWMHGVRQVRGAQLEWLEWLRETLPEELRGSIVNVVQKGPELRVLAISAAWSARLRYALAVLDPQISERAPVIVKVIVRVAPAGRTDARR
jgi:hypothetical protein